MNKNKLALVVSVRTLQVSALHIPRVGGFLSDGLRVFPFLVSFPYLSGECLRLGASSSSAS